MSLGRIQIPAVGLGTWKSEPGAVANAVQAAYDAGYRHFDCAAIYMNEKEVGTVLKKLKRDEIFVTSKLWNTYHKKEAVPLGLQQTLKDLQLEYLDLYLMHWPLAFKQKEGCESEKQGGTPIIADVSIKETWQAMEKLVDEKKVKAIGVSNFSVRQMKELLSFARIKPAVNQVECHPLLPQEELLAYCKSIDCVLTAYAPLGSGDKELLSHPVVNELAKKHSKTPAQILLSFHTSRDCAVIPKSTNPQRIKENFTVIKLPKDDVEKLANIGRSKPKRYIDPQPLWGMKPGTVTLFQ